MLAGGHQLINCMAHGSRLLVFAPAWHGMAWHVWGVQVPSHLFEHFARDPRVVLRWARRLQDVPAQWKGDLKQQQQEGDACEEPAGDPPPLELVEEALVSRQEFAAIEVQTQLLLALVDQVSCSLMLIENN